MQIERTIRIRNNVGTSTKGVKTPDHTVEGTIKLIYDSDTREKLDIEREDERFRGYLLELSDKQEADLSKRYPIEESGK